jgi:hypothetical protein
VGLDPQIFAGGLSVKCIRLGHKRKKIYWVQKTNGGR